MKKEQSTIKPYYAVVGEKGIVSVRTTDKIDLPAICTSKKNALKLKRLMAEPCTIRLISIVPF